MKISNVGANASLVAYKQARETGSKQSARPQTNTKPNNWVTKFFLLVLLFGTQAIRSTANQAPLIAFSSADKEPSPNLRRNNFELQDSIDEFKIDPCRSSNQYKKAYLGLQNWPNCEIVKERPACSGTKDTAEDVDTCLESCYDNNSEGITNPEAFLNATNEDVFNSANNLVDMARLNTAQNYTEFCPTSEPSPAPTFLPTPFRTPAPSAGSTDGASNTIINNNSDSETSDITMNDILTAAGVSLALFSGMLALCCCCTYGAKKVDDSKAKRMKNALLKTLNKQASLPALRAIKQVSQLIAEAENEFLNNLIDLEDDYDGVKININFLNKAYIQFQENFMEINGVYGIQLEGTSLPYRALDPQETPLTEDTYLALPINMKMYLFELYVTENADRARNGDIRGAEKSFFDKLSSFLRSKETIFSRIEPFFEQSGTIQHVTTPTLANDLHSISEIASVLPHSDETSKKKILSHLALILSIPETTISFDMTLLDHDKFPPEVVETAIKFLSDKFKSYPSQTIERDRYFLRDMFSGEPIQLVARNIPHSAVELDCSTATVFDLPETLKSSMLFDNDGNPVHIRFFTNPFETDAYPVVLRKAQPKNTQVTDEEQADVEQGQHSSEEGIVDPSTVQLGIIEENSENRPEVIPDNCYEEIPIAELENFKVLVSPNNIEALLLLSDSSNRHLFNTKSTFHGEQYLSLKEVLALVTTHTKPWLPFSSSRSALVKKEAKKVTPATTSNIYVKTGGTFSHTFKQKTVTDREPSRVYEVQQGARLPIHATLQILARKNETQPKTTKWEAVSDIRHFSEFLSKVIETSKGYEKTFNPGYRPDAPGAIEDDHFLDHSLDHSIEGNPLPLDTLMRYQLAARNSSLANAAPDNGTRNTPFDEHPFSPEEIGTQDADEEGHLDSNRPPVDLPLSENARPQPIENNSAEANSDESGSDDDEIDEDLTTVVSPRPRPEQPQNGDMRFTSPKVTPPTSEKAKSTLTPQQPPAGDISSQYRHSLSAVKNNDQKNGKSPLLVQQDLADHIEECTEDFLL